jgi:hypothetical protein
MTLYNYDIDLVAKNMNLFQMISAAVVVTYHRRGGPKVYRGPTRMLCLPRVTIARMLVDPAKIRPSGMG